MRIVYYITAHGFGHASRSIEIINALRDLRPDADVVIRSSVPRWFLESSVRRPIEIEPVETDTGMVQVDSLTFDEEGTVARAAAFYRDFDRRVSDEAASLRALRPSLVVGDVPPLAFAAAAEAGVMSAAVANFTWDWIYAYYPQFETLAPTVVPMIRNAYRHATTALRLPFHGGFETITAIREVPLVARRSRIGRADARRILGLDSDRPIVLASFGGHTLTLPYADIAKDGRFTLIVTDYEAGRTDPAPHLKLYTPAELSSKGLRYVDLVAASDVVVSKPGYGIVSECIANGASLLYASRGRFIENAVFNEMLPKVLRSRQIEHDDMAAGRWSDGIEALVGQPPPPSTLEANGAEVAAGILAERLS